MDEKDQDAPLPVSELTDAQRAVLDENWDAVNKWVLDRIQEVIDHGAGPGDVPCDDWCIGLAATTAVDALSRDQARMLVVRLLRLLTAQTGHPRCGRCLDRGAVCENHPGLPWAAYCCGSRADVCEHGACQCGAGMPCPACCSPIPQDGTVSATTAFVPDWKRDPAAVLGLDDLDDFDGDDRVVA
jgi:hypothetical protein